MFPEQPFQKDIDNINAKSSVLPIGLSLPSFQEPNSEDPIFIWNHRWEYDKNPKLFFETLFRLKERGMRFQLVVLGKSYKKAPPIFDQARIKLKDEILHFGFVQTYDEYRKWLQRANIMFVTSNQDFFGISIVEAISAGCYPVLPDRLSYKEHVPSQEFAQHIYNEEECFDKLEKVVRDKLYLKNEKSRSFVQKYDWENIIEEYDTALSVS